MTRLSRIEDGLLRSTSGNAFSDSEFIAAALPAGGWFTDYVSLRAGTAISKVAVRARLRPTHLSLAGLILGLLSGAALAWAHSAILAVELFAILGWQLAYAFDCSDGQVARLTNTGSEAGGDLDRLVDTAVQSAFLAAIAKIAIAQGKIPSLLVGAFVATWSVSAVTTLLAQLRSASWDAEALKPRNFAILLTRQVRDYPLTVLILSVTAVFFSKNALYAGLVFYTFINCSSLFLHIVWKSIRSLRGNV